MNDRPTLTRGAGNPTLDQWVQDYLAGLQQTLAALPQDRILALIEVLRQGWHAKRQLFAFANGGSAATASHFVADLGKGASDKLPHRFRCLCLADNAAWVTAVGNDDSFTDVYVRQLENFAQPGDIVLTLSVSGNSANLVKAVEWANAHGLETIAFTGGKRGQLAALARHPIVVDSPHYGFVEDAHMILCHILAYAFMENPALAAAR